MRAKLKRGSGGRKKFSAAKLAGPENSVDRNIDLLAAGDCAANPQLAKAFKVVALWEKFHSPRWPNKKAARSLEGRLLRLLRESLSRIEPQMRKGIFNALACLDPEPFKSIATAIEVTRRVNESGAFQTQLVRAALLGQEKFGIETDATGCLRLPVTLKEFADEYAARFGGSVNRDFLRRECQKRLGWQFKPDKTGRPKTPTIVP
ncbi:MAG: hypothetical protein ABSC01_10040 [Verrucomicrobiota bacterium]|jgi:hypothetical protein